MAKGIKCYLSLLLLGSMFSPHAAEIGLDQSNGANSLIFSGEIKQGDSELLKPYIEKARSNGNPRRFIIHSEGGNVTEAMKIGSLLRKSNFSVFEPQGVSCFSACVFAIMSGTNRVINGRIGLHHPLFLNAPSNNPQVQKLLLEGKQAMTQYTMQMNVAPKIVEDMYALPNEADIKYLNQNEIRVYRLSTNE